ncbi:hypothetical protein OH76DRAFT_1412221 [Lentinus brumalis]|uniref:Uncharacterized protein n=1 Tax=Lentinus brumalis TaxID=2498619 RepID=A0A371CLY7_9APHY|nr:hypothetical protein OH76DRAFT_1412221 [Polyporus brumalis]
MSLAVRGASLPHDVIHTIATLVGRADLPPFLLTNRHMNKLLTPVLYATIDLGAWDNIKQCLRTLTAPAESYACGRDLAGLVRTFKLRRPLTRLPYYVSKASLAEDVLRIVARMPNLRSFSSSVWLGEQSSEILYTLLSGSSPLLRSIDMHAGYDPPLSLQDLDTCKWKEAAFHGLPSLHSLKLEAFDSLSAGHMVLLQTLFAACAPTLRSLSLQCRPKAEVWTSVLPPHAIFSSLQALEIDGNALAHPSLAHAAGVRSLKVTSAWDTAHAPPAGIFPGLSELSCPRTLIPTFLPERTAHRRPIQVIRVDNVSLERSDGWHSRDEHPPTCSDLLPVFACLQNSAVPVTSLSFQVERITDSELELLRPAFQALEYLAINVTHKAPQHTDTELLSFLVWNLVAHLPRLHTFLVGGGKGPWYTKPLTVAQLERLARISIFFQDEVLRPAIEQCPPSLRRIACLTDSLELFREEDGWHWFAGVFLRDGHGFVHEIKPGPFRWWEEEDAIEVKTPEHSVNGDVEIMEEDSSDSELDTRFLPRSDD